MFLVGGLAMPAGALAPKKLGAIAAPVSLIPADDATVPISLSGLHRYFGTIEIDATSTGLVVSDRLPLERYLLGLNEVPVRWPVEALRAQAVAARTYALWTLARPAAGAAATYGFDICASVECQVFSGADVVLASDGDRWFNAVSDTSGVAILYGGEPILARYSSTTGGRTLANPEAFPDEQSYPYLQSVPSPTERASPLYRWRTRFPLVDLEHLLRDAGIWGDDLGRLTDARTVASRAGFHYPDVVLTGTDGREVVTAEMLRDELRDSAPQNFPGRYPSRAPTSGGRLPETFPSNRYEMATRSGVARVVGRGWGHAVGMSQWGAYGLALRGATYPQILTHYYTGVEVAPVTIPEQIEVGLGWDVPQVRAAGAFSIVDGRGRTIVDDALGTWTFVPAGAGAVAVNPPRGHGLPLHIGVVDAPSQATTGERIVIGFALSTPARVSIEAILGTSGESVAEPTRVFGAGRRALGLPAPQEPGLYHIELTASAGGVTRRDGVDIEIAAPPTPGVRRPPPDPVPTGGPAVNLLAVALLAAAAAVLAGLAVTIRG